MIRRETYKWRGEANYRGKVKMGENIDLKHLKGFAFSFKFPVF